MKVKRVELKTLKEHAICDKVDRSKPFFYMSEPKVVFKPNGVNTYFLENLGCEPVKVWKWNKWNICEPRKVFIVFGTEKEMEEKYSSNKSIAYKLHGDIYDPQLVCNKRHTIAHSDTQTLEDIISKVQDIINTYKCSGDGEMDDTVKHLEVAIVNITKEFKTGSK